MKLNSIIQAYMHKKDIERALKNYNEKVSAIAKSILVDKTAKESIAMLQDIKALVDSRLEEELEASRESVYEITKYKNPCN